MVQFSNATHFRVFRFRGLLFPPRSVIKAHLKSAQHRRCIKCRNNFLMCICRPATGHHLSGRHGWWKTLSLDEDKSQDDKDGIKIRLGCVSSEDNWFPHPQRCAFLWADYANYETLCEKGAQALGEAFLMIEARPKIMIATRFSWIFITPISIGRVSMRITSRDRACPAIMVAIWSQSRSSARRISTYCRNSTTTTKSRKKICLDRKLKSQQQCREWGSSEHQAKQTWGLLD